jgi:hypothetical protein
LYPSIPHLPGSRAKSDRSLSPESKEARLCTGEGKPVRDAGSYDVIVQEKLDGSCVAIVREQGELVARGREGRLASESQNPGRQMFAAWAEDNQERIAPLVGEGEVLVGEWLALVHGTIYELSHELFVPFDLLRGPSRARTPIDELTSRLAPTGLSMPAVIHRGGPIAIDVACMLLGEHGKHGAIDPPEGLVYRVERAGKVVVVAKWVRPDKVDGSYLPENSGLAARYHRGGTR